MSSLAYVFGAAVSLLSSVSFSVSGQDILENGSVHADLGMQALHQPAHVMANAKENFSHRQAKPPHGT